VKKVLVISDTHSYIDDRIIKYASEADYVIHAGDVGMMLKLFLRWKSKYFN